MANGGGGGVGDYSREAIILNIVVKGRRGGGGNYSREAIYRGTAIIRGNTVLMYGFSLINWSIKDKNIRPREDEVFNPGLMSCVMSCFSRFTYFRFFHIRGYYRH